MLELTIGLILLGLGAAVTIFLLITVPKKSNKNVVDVNLKDSNQQKTPEEQLIVETIKELNSSLDDTYKNASKKVKTAATSTGILSSWYDKNKYDCSYACGYTNHAYGSDVWTLPRWDRDPDFIRRNMHSWGNYIQFYLGSKDDFDVLDDIKMGDIAYLRYDDEFYIYLGKDFGWESYTSDNYLKLWERIENK